MAKLPRQERNVWKRNLKSWLATANGSLSLTEASEIRKAMTAKLRDPEPLPDVSEIDIDVPLGSDKALPVPHSKLLDIGYILKNMTLPKPEDYPSKLFQYDLLEQPNRAVIEYVQGCAHMSLKTDVHYEQSMGRLFKSNSGYLDQFLYTCTLSLEIPGICKEVTIGHGRAKKDARMAAWLHTISSMHCNGSLKALFLGKQALESDVNTSTFDSAVHDPTSPEQADDEEMLEPADLTDETMTREAGAKIEVYDFAASLGIVPVFEYEVVTPALGRSQRIRHQGSMKPYVKATLKVKELGLELSALEIQEDRADVAVCLAFKEHMDQLKIESRDSRIAEALADSTKRWPLCFANVWQFLNFYTSQKGHMNMEMESETHPSVGRGSKTKAQLTLDGEPAGLSVTLPSKKQAERLAHLVAAVHLAKANPEIIVEFTRLNELNITLPRSRPVPEIPLRMGYEAISVMRKGIIQAHQAGLPHPGTEPVMGEMPDPHTVSFLNPFTSSQLAQASRDLSSKYNTVKNDPNISELHSKKLALPVRARWRSVIDLVSKHPVSIISGATGSGKTTQVPQIIFEHYINKGRGATCNVICTQPRRIAATSVARRVALERNEALGEHVGYQVRFDAQMCEKPGSINYCTTGILLLRLQQQNDAWLDSVSHIVIDEVHERSRDVDFLMVMLKRMMAARQAASRPMPKIVLMSATLDTELFSHYFGSAEETVFQPCPYMNIAGRHFDVQEVFLGELFQAMNARHSRELDRLLNENNKDIEYLKSEIAYSKSFHLKEIEAVCNTKAEAVRLEASAHSLIAQHGLVPVDLAAATIAHVCNESQDGSILAFFPGLDDINTSQKTLTRPGGLLGIDFSDKTKYAIQILHSSLLRTDLQDTCLAVKAHQMVMTSSTGGSLPSVADFLAEAIEPPSASAVASAIASLKAMEAFTSDERLTDLGRMLSEFPLHPTLGKLVVLGIIFRCLDPMIVIGAAGATNSPFLRPSNKQSEADTCHAKYFEDRSDHLAILSVFEGLRNALKDEGSAGFRKYTTANFLHPGVLRGIIDVAKQIALILVKGNIIPPLAKGSHGFPALYSAAELNQNSNNKSLIRGLLLATLYPNLAIKTAAKSPAFRTPDDESITMHPSSANSFVRLKRAGKIQGTLTTYQSLKKSIDGSRIYGVNATEVEPLLAILFGGTIEMQDLDRLLKDTWIPFKVEGDRAEYATKLMLEYRKVLDKVVTSAFRSLARKEGPGGTRYLADDPARDAFTNNVAELL
ncbi:hypothetical protein K431DRAFT_240048, partial [Polychaeton citri CBS 116435]